MHFLFTGDCMHRRTKRRFFSGSRSQGVKYWDARIRGIHFHGKGKREQEDARKGLRVRAGDRSIDASLSFSCQNLKAILIPSFSSMFGILPFHRYLHVILPSPHKEAMSKRQQEWVNSYSLLRICNRLLSHHNCHSSSWFFLCCCSHC